jgi:hypothetical protein
MKTREFYNLCIRLKCRIQLLRNEHLASCNYLLDLEQNYYYYTAILGLDKRGNSHG